MCFHNKKGECQNKTELGSVINLILPLVFDFTAERMAHFQLVLSGINSQMSFISH